MALFSLYLTVSLLFFVSVPPSISFTPTTTISLSVLFFFKAFSPFSLTICMCFPFCKLSSLVFITSPSSFLFSTLVLFFFPPRSVSPALCQVRRLVGGGSLWQLLERLQSGDLACPLVNCLLRRVRPGEGVTGSWHALPRHVFDVVVSVRVERTAASVGATFTLRTVRGSLLCTCHGISSHAEHSNLVSAIWLKSVILEV